MASGSSQRVFLPAAALAVIAAFISLDEIGVGVRWRGGRGRGRRLWWKRRAAEAALERNVRKTNYGKCNEQRVPQQSCCTATWHPFYLEKDGSGEFALVPVGDLG